MKRFLLVCLGVFIGLEVCVMAQQSRTPGKREVATPVPGIAILDNPEKVATPIPETQIYDYIRGPAEEIFILKVRDGLKRFLLADLYAKHGD
ncbi:MAG: hypothetical protein GY797_03985, partial [Deltaproteobacteria bacterium]|nr:hypothetical protein [Deltaproteobacteria bacterium]